jgi:type I restriction enzyme S subunit
MSWPLHSIASLCKIVSGATPKTGRAEFWDGDVSWVTPKDLSDLNSKFLLDTPRKITEEGLKSCSATMLPERSVLFSSRAPIGLVAINETPVCTNQGFKSFVPDQSRLSSDYLYWWLKTHRQQLERLGRGATFKEVSKSIVSEIQIPLPPLAEQKRIAGILDAADRLRAKRCESLAQLDTFLQSIFLELFGDPVTNPKGWEVKPLGEFVKFIGGSQPPKSTFLDYPKDGYVRLIQIRDFKTDKYPTYIPEKLAKRPFEKEDVMIARYGPPVFQILKGLSGSYNVALMKADPIGPICRRFLFHLLQKPALHGAVVAQSTRTAGQTGVNLKFLNKYLSYLPPLDLQKHFAAIVESVEQQKAKQRAHLAELDALFASLQSRAFNGEL